MLDFKGQRVTQNQVMTDHIFIRTTVSLSFAHNVIELRNNDNLAIALDDCTYIAHSQVATRMNPSIEHFVQIK